VETVVNEFCKKMLPGSRLKIYCQSFHCLTLLIRIRERNEKILLCIFIYFHGEFLAISICSLKIYSFATLQSAISCKLLNYESFTVNTFKHM